MKIKILSPLWGHEHLELPVFLDKIRMAGYDGIDTSIPTKAIKKKQLLDYLQKHEMCIVAHEYQAEGRNFTEFKESYKKNLYYCAESNPVLINSHTGRDYYSLEQNLELIDIAQEVSEKTGFIIAHETHRGRIGFSPFVIKDYFKARELFSITADFSHWVCVSESFLEGFSETLSEAITRTRHVHARIGYEQGPQVPDPSAPEWNYAMIYFLTWWDKIVISGLQQQREVLTFTTEFGPPPYLHTIPFTKEPVANQFEINCFMKDVLNNRYSSYRNLK